MISARSAWRAGLSLGDAEVDQSFRRYIALAATVGLVIYALELIGLVALGALLGGDRSSIEPWLARASVSLETFVLLAFGAKTVVSLLTSVLTLRSVRRLVLMLSRKMTTNHLRFTAPASGEEGRAAEMVRNCVNLVTYLDGNYFRQVGNLVQECVLVALVAGYVVSAFREAALVLLGGLALVMLFFRQFVSRAIARRGERVVKATGTVIETIGDMHRLRKELNVWGALPEAEQRVFAAMRSLLTPHYQSEWLIGSIRPMLEFLAIAALIITAMSRLIEPAAMVLVGVMLVRVLPSITRLQMAVSAISASAAARDTVRRVLSWQ